MLSLVYNRGSSLKGDSRKEMKQIQQAFKAGRISDVPKYLLKMKILWVNDKKREVLLTEGQKKLN